MHLLRSASRLANGGARGFRASRLASAKVLFVGLAPEYVDYKKFAHLELTPEKLKSGLAMSIKQVTDLGHECAGCWTDDGATAATVVRDELAKGYDCVVIGAGVRTDADLLPLFEQLINIIHEDAPNAKICFNTSPDSTAAAVQRWLK